MNVQLLDATSLTLAAKAAKTYRNALRELAK